MPRIVTEVSNLLALLRAEGCMPVDLLPGGCLLGAQCAICSAPAALRCASPSSVYASYAPLSR